MAMLKVTQVKSIIGTKPKTRGTVRALGLRGIGQTNVLPDRPEIRGMIRRVPHLIRNMRPPLGFLVGPPHARRHALLR